MTSRWRPMIISTNGPSNKMLTMQAMTTRMTPRVLDRIVPMRRRSWPCSSYSPKVERTSKLSWTSLLIITVMKLIDY